MTTAAALIESGLLVENVSLGPLTTYKSGGPARLMAMVDDPDDLEAVVSTGITTQMKTLILGRGSNLVVSDAGFEGLVIRLGASFAKISYSGTVVTAGAAVPLARLARSSVGEGLTGLEFFVGIPGSVGGAIRQNAGCFGTETKNRLVAAHVLNLRTGERRSGGPMDLEMEYRRSNIGPDEVVLEAEFSGEKGDPERGSDLIRRITRWRKENQPGGTLNAGSVFKNPEGISAGELIDNLGLKGLAVGDVSVSEKHANFFVAGPNATSADIRKLFMIVKDRVLELSGTNLESEIQFIGFEE